MNQAQDVFDLLLPDATPTGRDRARLRTRFLRLLADDARGDHEAGRVSVDPVRAAAEHAERERSHLLEAVLDLTRLNWNAGLSADSFLDAEPSTRSHQAAWSQLERARSRRSGLPEVPAPGESSPDVLARLIAAAQALGLSAAEATLWKRRHALLTGQLDCAGVARDHEALRRAGATVAIFEASLADVGAALLDVGRVAGALAYLEARRPSPGSRAESLVHWCQVLLGGPAQPSWFGATGCVPSALCELRDARPELGAHLAGAPTRGRRAAPRRRYPRSRAEAGALVLVHVRSIDDRWTSVAADLEADAQQVLARRLRGHATRRSGAPEQAVVLEAAPVVRFDPAAEERLDPRARLVVLVPERDAAGEVCGWLHLEWAHRLAPSRACLERWSEELSADPEAPEVTLTGGEDEPLHCDPIASPEFHTLVRELGMKTEHRRWRGYAVRAGEPVPVAEGGAGLGSSALGGARGRARALRTGGPVTFTEPDARLATWSSAGSGLVIPVRWAGRVVGLFSIESERRRDFREADVTRLVERLQGASLVLRLAAFTEWHRRRYGKDLGWAPRAAGTRSRAQRVAVCARSQRPVSVVGPVGSGRRVTARWIHEESGRATQPLVEVAAARLGGLAPVSPAAGLLVHGLEGASAQGIARLAAELEEPARRVLVTSTVAPLALAADGGLDRDLARRLGRLVVTLAPLDARRDELLPMIEAGLASIAAGEGWEPVGLEEEALALLWRQPWPGGIPELEDALYRLAVSCPGERLDAQGVCAVLTSFGATLHPRLPSRHPRESDVRAALAQTRLESGRWNKTRAAAWLGWDPDTLVARMGDLGVEAPR